MPSQKSGLFVKGLFTTKALFSAEGSFGKFFGGKNAGIPMDSIYGNVSEKTQEVLPKSTISKGFWGGPYFR